MSRKPHPLSLFAQPLDRAAFVAYFLGAVVPLAALAWVVQRWVQPVLDTSETRWIVLVALVSIGLLSLGSFLALRRTAHGAVARLDAENRRLGSLLEASHALAVAGDEQEVFHLAAQSAREIAASRSGFVVARDGEADELKVLESSGNASPGALELVLAAAREALDALRPAVAGADSASGELAVAVPCGAGMRLAGALVVFHDDGRPHDSRAIPVLATLSSFVTVALRNDDLREAERNFFTHATSLLVATLDRYLDDRPDHARRVAALANRLGRALELPESRLERLHFAALLHDIGMLRIARDNVNDRDEIRRHPVLGDEMLRPIRLWEDLAPFVRHHQEWFDGSGYPDHLKGEEIPLESRIIAVAEAFDAMTALRSYKPPVSIDEAFLRLKGGSGTQFDPAVVATLLRLHAEDALV